MVLHAGVSHTARWMEKRSTELLTGRVHILPVLGALRARPVSTGAICGRILWVVSRISAADAVATRGGACRLILCICICIITD